jgi:hypothetical protein
LWYGGEFEYKYKISDRIDFSSSFIPGYPDLMNLAVGVNLKLINGKNFDMNERAATNTGFASGGLTCKPQLLCYY